MSTPLMTDAAELLDIEEVREAAEHVMPEAYRDFVNNRGMDKTLRDDISAWNAMHLRPRALVDVHDIDTSVSILGSRISMPIITAPFVGSSFVDPEGEIATARGAMAAGTITTLSMNGSRTPEQVGDVAAGFYWQQLYFVRDRDVVRDVVARAVASGASALCLTVDLPVMPSFPRPMRDAMGALFERWGEEEHMMYAVRDYRDKPFGATFPNPGITWADLEWVRGLSDLPLILKGVIRPEDAVLARDHGAAAVIVSNHAGQGLRASQPVAHALPGIVAAVGSDIEVYADSGIRTGADVLRALALGARSVLIGRPTLWGLAAAGAAGVERVLQILQAELAEVMAITGAARIGDVDRSVLGGGAAVTEPSNPAYTAYRYY
ncbi:alpha-hydroxy acid oxidase [Microbacterium pygmaeum]|uniref:4-hydroxymandelate oxidase n=1 Tax=Microbacterium pygmaeum TaxID=370764 RepID=A0A1G7VGQ0_9MICO|nr:alpha-hydroxy acid oxidase [Microbacterium pygmaeum]SDG58914.1 4-hydroxymandelate oxidase [Microbacterium pygmaeum]